MKIVEFKILDEIIKLKIDSDEEYNAVEQLINKIEKIYKEIDEKYQNKVPTNIKYIMTMIKLGMEIEKVKLTTEVEIDFLREISDIVVSLEQYLNMPASEEGETQHY